MKKTIIWIIVSIFVALIGVGTFMYIKHEDGSPENNGIIDDGNEIIESNISEGGVDNLLPPVSYFEQNGEWLEYYFAWNWNEPVTLNYKVKLADGEWNGERFDYLKKDGERICYDGKGNITEEGNITNLRKEGERIYYYENGQIREKLNFKDGELNGEWIYYDEDGKIHSEGAYKDGENNGEWKYYDKNGNIRRINMYKNGRLIN